MYQVRVNGNLHEESASFSTIQAVASQLMKSGKKVSVHFSEAGESKRMRMWNHPVEKG